MMIGKYYYFKVFYLGDNYYGLARQPNLKTIEGELIKALIKKKYLKEINNSKYLPLHFAGRTDKKWLCNCLYKVSTG